MSNSYGITQAKVLGRCQTLIGIDLDPYIYTSGSGTDEVERYIEKLAHKRSVDPSDIADPLPLDVELCALDWVIENVALANANYNSVESYERDKYERIRELYASYRVEREREITSSLIKGYEDSPSYYDSIRNVKLIR
jgi:hypothetical protein